MSERDVWDRLETVHDAHVPVSLRRMGMIRGVEISNDRDVTVCVAIPCLACPAVSMMRDQIRAAVGSIADIGSIVIDDGGAGTWSRDHVEASAKPFMRQFGLQI